MNMTDQSNQIRPNSFGYDQCPSNIDWTRFQAGPGTFMNNIYNGYPTQPNINAVPSSFPFYSGVANPYHNMNPFTSTTNTVTTMASSYSMNNMTGTQPSSVGGFNDFQSITTHMPFRCKRKTDSPPPQPTKQHITEERMAMHMSQLHISSESVPGTSKIPEQEGSESREKRLYMCEEMRKFQTESILPQSLINKIQMPCTALVLWQPPQKPFPLPNTEPVDDDNNNNNNDVVSNNNLDNDLELDGIEVEAEGELSTMDLDGR